MTKTIVETLVNSSIDQPILVGEKEVNLSGLTIALIVVCVAAAILIIVLVAAILIKRRMNINAAPNIVAHNNNDDGNDGEEFDQVMSMVKKVLSHWIFRTFIFCDH